MSFNTNMPHIPRIPSIAEQLGNGVELQKALGLYIAQLKQSIEKKGHKGRLYIDLPSGKSLELGKLIADHGFPGFVTVSAIDEEGNENHLMMHYSQVVVRMVVDKSKTAED